MVLRAIWTLVLFGGVVFVGMSAALELEWDPSGAAPLDGGSASEMLSPDDVRAASSNSFHPQFPYRKVIFR